MPHTIAVQDNGGLWDASAAPGAAAAAAGAAATVGGSSSHSPSQLGLPVWVWNGLHAYAPSAAAVLVEALDLLTSSISVGLQQVTAATPAATAPGSNDHMGHQQQQQQQEVLPPAVPDKQQHVSVVEQRWRVAQLALLAAAATTLTALKNGTGPVTTLQEQQLGVPNVHSQGQEPPPTAGAPADTVAAGQAAPAGAAPGPSTSTAPAVAGAETGVAGQLAAGLPETGWDTPQQQKLQDSLPGLQQQPQPQGLMQQLAPGAVPADPPVQQQQQTLPGDPQQPVSAVPQPLAAAAAMPGNPGGAAAAAPPAEGGPAPGAGGTSQQPQQQQQQQQPSQQLGAQTVAA